MNSSRRMLGMFAFFWSAMLSVFVGFAAWSVGGQISTYGFAGTQGWVDQIRTKTHQNSDDAGETTGVEIAYHYYVDHKRYNSTRMRYGQVSFSGNWARTYVGAHPVDSSMTVYYSRADPSRAVLVRGLEGFDLFVAMFLSPFLCVAAALWWAALAGRGNRGLAGMRVLEGTTLVRLRPGLGWVIATGLGALTIGTFIGTFGLAFLSLDQHASMRTGEAVWAVVLLAVAVSCGVSFWRLITGRRDIVIDSGAKMLWIRGKRMVPFGELKRIDVIEDAGASANGKAITFNAQLRYGEAEKIKLRERPTLLEPTRRLATFLALQLGIEAFDESGKPLTPAPA